MNRCLAIAVAVSVGLSAAAFAQGGGLGQGGMTSHPSVTGGAFGTSAAAPGTNSLGTALYPGSAMAQ